MKVFTLSAVSSVAFAVTAAAQSATSSAASAGQTIVITVGGNTTHNASTVFQPAEVRASLGDTVLFNFTQGNHTATQAEFFAPCVPAHISNITVNGFNSDFRDAGNGTAITILSVPILPENVNTTMWFFDYNTCAEGGVGVINANDSSTETLAGFSRNAQRLNGTATSSSASHSQTSPSSSSTQTTSSSSSSDAQRVVLGGAATLPLLLMAVLAL